MTCITPGALWPDTDGIHINAHGGGILFDAGTYYWFGEHRGDGSAGYNAKVGVTCYSSTDLVHWKNESVALRVTEHGGPQTRADGDDIIYDKIGLDRNTDVPHGTYRIIEPGWEIEIGCILERPKVIRSSATGKYVMWFHLEFRGYGYGPAHVGVAVSDQPTGPYRFVEAFRPGNGESRDMTLFVDEEGQAYHIGASENNDTIHINPLTPDCLRCTGETVRVFVGRRMEAPAFFHHRGKYYFMGSGCSGWDPNIARSAVADSFRGPWTELGNPCIGPNADRTFGSQSTFFLKVQGKQDAFIYMGDRWNSKNLIDSRYIWLPVSFEDDRFVLRWQDTWDLNATHLPHSFAGPFATPSYVNSRQA